MKKIDFTGLKKGRVLVIREISNRLWECKCDCGKIFTKTSSAIIQKTLSCGCLLREMVKARTVDLTGKRFGRLVVLGLVGPRESGGYVWKCLCDCGIERNIHGSGLKYGDSKSCGCLKNEIVKIINMTHGQSKKTKTYRSWAAMKERCSNPHHVSYSSYGGRGIKVCDRWKESFENFFEDMGECPENMSIDRINNDGNYEPGNCRWATAKEQNMNSRHVRWTTFLGMTKSLNQWCQYFDMEKGYFNFLIYSKKVSIEWIYINKVLPFSFDDGIGLREISTA